MSSAGPPRRRTRERWRGRSPAGHEAGANGRMASSMNRCCDDRDSTASRERIARSMWRDAARKQRHLAALAPARENAHRGSLVTRYAPIDNPIHRRPNAPGINAALRGFASTHNTIGRRCTRELSRWKLRRLLSTLIECRTGVAGARGRTDPASLATTSVSCSVRDGLLPSRDAEAQTATLSCHVPG